MRDESQYQSGVPWLLHIVQEIGLYTNQALAKEQAANRIPTIISKCNSLPV